MLLEIEVIVLHVRMYFISDHALCMHFAVDAVEVLLATFDFGFDAGIFQCGAEPVGNPAHDLALMGFEPVVFEFLR